MSVVKVGPLGLPALYVDGGKRITTHSMLKSYLRCPKQAQYKYAERLKKKVLTRRDKPLRRGVWMHELLEVYYRGEDWRKRHAELTAKFNNLFDEEKDELGDLPTECLALMKSYLWHYGANKDDPMHGWKVHGTEITLECPWPDSEDGLDVYRCRVDVMYEDDWGWWIGDHKSHKSLPSMGFRVLDTASPLYIWCARENGYDVQGFVWNYLRTKVPTTPQMVYVGTARERLSQAAIDTDWPTYARAIKAYGLDHTAEPYRSKLRELRSHRWQHGVTQTSPFFRREVLEKDDDMIARVVAAMMKTRDRMHSDYDDFETVARSSDRSCDWCDYGQVCMAELFTGEAQQIRRKMFRVGDPLDYYQDKKEQTDD